MMTRPLLSRFVIATTRTQVSRLCSFPGRLAIPLRRPPFVAQRRGLIAAPKQGGPPLLERSSNRDLPDVRPSRSYLIHIPLFLLSMYIASNLLFNYQRSSSSVVSSTLYALRVNPEARELLGDEITFKSKTIPWIRGTMDQLHGQIDISYRVKGTKTDGMVHFSSTREGGRAGKFKTKRWALEMSDGQILNLLVDESAIQA